MPGRYMFLLYMWKKWPPHSVVEGSSVDESTSMQITFILLQNWVPWFTYHVVLDCGTYYVKVTCHSCPSILSQVMVLFLLRCLLGRLLLQCCRCPCHWAPPATAAFFNWDLLPLPLPSSTGTSPTTPRPQSEGFSFVLSYSLFSLNCSMYVSIETRYYFYSCCDVKVLISGDDIRVNIYFLLYVFCWNDLKSKNDAIFLGYT
jgi:hypothetical protein